MVLGEFLVVSSWVWVFSDVFNVLISFGVPFWFLVLLTVFRCPLKVLGVLKIFGDVRSWFLV